MYGHDGDVTRAILTYFSSPFLRSLHIKLELNWPSGLRKEDV